MEITRIGVDIAKNVFQVHGVDAAGQVVWARQLRRNQFLKSLILKLEPDCEIGMEACSGAHHWARQLRLKDAFTNLGIAVTIGRFQFSRGKD